MTQTTEDLGLRPVAKALGMSVVAMRHLRLGHVGQGAQPVDDAVQLGRLLGRDLLGVHGVHGDLGAEPVLAEDQREGDDQHQGVGHADRDQDADDQPVEQDEEEPRHEHAVGQAAVGLDVA